MEKFKYKIGDILKDKITGFQGVVMARADYYTGCSQYGLYSQTLKDGKPMEWEWFDEILLDDVESAEHVINKSEEPNGGPAPNAPQM